MWCDIRWDCSLSLRCLWKCRWHGDGGEYLYRWGTTRPRGWQRWTYRSYINFIPRLVPAFTLEAEAPQAAISSSVGVHASEIEGEINSENWATSHIQKAHPPQQIIGNLNKRVTWSSRSAHLSCFTNILFVALFEPRDVGHVLSNLSWVNAMHKDLENFERNQVWTLVEPPHDVNVIGTKWIFKNK
jgi:hypothetical protein